MRTVVVAGLIALLLGGATLLRAQDESPTTVEKKVRVSMRIKLTSVFVDDQDKALKFYTETLGFVKKNDIPVGDFKWLTVVSADDPDGTELLLEPNAHEIAKSYQAALYEKGIPAATFFVESVQTEYDKLQRLGVKFTVQPTDAGTAKIAIFDDTCGNLIQIAQE